MWDVLESRRNGMWIVAAVACLAAVLSVVIAAHLSQVAVTLTRNELVLACPYHGRGAHTHDESCYDDDGNLVCPLEERELHTHDASCYDKNGVVICGKEEVTDTHVHGAGCFVDASSIPMPRQLFTGAAGNVIVSVEAPEGAFPEGTNMIVEAVDGQTVQGAVESVLPEDTELAAVDITFENALGKKVQPRIPVKVTMTSLTSPTKAKPLVLHLDDEGAAGLVMQDAPNSLNTVTFEADSFSVYVMAVKRLQQTLTASDGRTYEISVTYTEEAKLPNDVELVVREIAETDSSFATVFGRAKNAATAAREDATVTNARFFDISLKKDGATLEPLAPVEVNIVLTSGIGLSDATSVVHFINSRKVEVVEAEAAPVDEKSDVGVDVTFTTNSFSVFGIMEMTLERYVLASDGQTYHVTVTYGPSANVPRDAQLAVEEIAPDSETYDAYLAQIENMLGWQAKTSDYARLFDIKIVNRVGQKVSVAAPVDVRIELADLSAAAENIQVLHFADDTDAPDVVTGVDVDGEAVSFEATGFSAYAIVDVPQHGSTHVETLYELNEHLGEGLRLYYGSPANYFTNAVNKGCLTEVTDYASASEWFFETVEGSSDTYRMYTKVNDQKQYLSSATNNNDIGLTDAASGAVTLTFEQAAQGKFYIKKSTENRWLQHSKSGGGIRFYTDKNNATNSQITLVYPDAGEPYKLDGKSYGFVNWAGGVTGRAMMASSSTPGTLDAKSLTVMCTSDNSSQLFVPNDSDISMWTFHWIAEDQYYLTTVDDGSTKYLKVDASGLSLVSAQQDATQVQFIPGSGIHADEVCLKAGNTTLTFSGTVAGGFSVNGSTGSEWMHMVELSELTTEYLRTYSASKASVSDPDITNGSRVIVYTRNWNEEKLKYEYYAIDSDGSLVQVFESGDSIEWVGGQINTLLWSFVEYYWEGTTDPNYYYELYNQYSEQFIVPQVADNQILSDETVGLILNGRRNGQYYSTIQAWDENNYAYAGLKVQDGKIVACPKSESMDFYFAVMRDMNVDDTLTTVDTVDNGQYGISMKLANFKTRKEMSDFLGNDLGGMTLELQQGLLSTNLTAGYPTANGGSLGNLYAKAQDVNHLFIQSTYSETGYFEFDSAQNFATLKGATGGDFTVYKELGSYDSGGDKHTLKHGQFFPFNDLEPGTFTSTNGKNLYSSTGTLLDDGDPRKYEQLYSVEYDGNKVDTFFGMELEAHFTQTPSGLDAWGHDIIFEFTGDDDFWLYVDDELVIDLGGIHSAVAGNVNFRTGAVYIGGKSPRWTTLRQLFYENYVGRGKSDAEAEAYVNGLFEQKFDDDGNALEDGHGNLVYTFKDETNHTMRIFYMERGAGASNLHMRFNLAAIRKGTVQLTKKLEGVNESDILAEFPYQIIYKMDGDTEYRLTNEKASSSTKNEDYVFYKDTVNPVRYLESLEVDGVRYEDVFMLKPGETADISFPEGMTSYRIVECGVNTEVYNRVTANDEVLAATSVSTNRANFGIGYATTDARPKVTYANSVNPDALRTLSITKRLFREDGTTEIEATEDGTEFTFRLFLASEFGALDLANMQAYHVKDPDGDYCVWNAEHQRFDKILDGSGQGIKDYAQLTEAQREAATFTTSIYGTIDKIAAGYTVEIREVLAGTQYRVEERPWEIPDGYSFQHYEYDGLSAQVVTRDNDEVKGVNGTVVSGHDDSVTIRNLKGWGLRMNKVWRDEEYMSSRDATYFALFTTDANGNLVKVNGSVRQLAYGTNPQSIYWYYEHLPVKGTTGVEDYAIYEVEVVGTEIPEVGTDGVVNEPVNVLPIKGNQTIQLHGKQKGEEDDSVFTYTVQYETGQTSSDSNVRVDIVTNDRPGLILMKRDWGGENPLAGNPLAGAHFRLADASGNTVGEFTSDETGLITIAFLSEGRDYTLTETSSPSGYSGMQAPLTIRAQGGKVTVTGEDADKGFYTLQQADGTNLATLTIQNRPHTFSAIKVDGDTGEGMQGVTFALHRQVTVDGVTAIDLNPMPGYEKLSTDEGGFIHGVDETLPAGTYELREKSTQTGYELLPSYIQFTISPTGVITLGTHPEGVTLGGTVSEQGTLEYVMTIANYRRKTVSFKKVDIENIEGSALQGAEFDLYRVVNGEQEESPMEKRLISGDDGMLANEKGEKEFQLPSGIYHLIETKAPEGYILKTDPVVVTVNADGVTYNEHTALSSNGRGVNEQNGVYLLLISNSQGFELPSTGSSETIVRAFIGASLVLGGAAALFQHRRRLMDER